MNWPLFAGNLLATEAGVKQSIFRSAFVEIRTGLTLRFGQAQQLDSIVLQNQRSDFVANRNVLEIGEPAIRGNERIIRTKQDFVLQARVCVLNERGRKVLWRPTRKVDVHVGLVQTNGNGLILPREGRCAMIIGKPGKSTATSSIG